MITRLHKQRSGRGIQEGLMLASQLFLTAWAAAAGTQPDIFFYLADDQNYWDYGFAGNEIVSTPNVDKLAGEGTLFSRAYTSMAICSPSRSSLYTGLYPMRNGCYMNHIPSRPGIKSIAHYLKAAGYKVILAGKSHVSPESVYDWSDVWPTVPEKGQRHGPLPLEKLEKFLAEETAPVCIFFASEFPHGPYPDVAPLSKDQFSPKPYQRNTESTRKRVAGYYENIRRDDDQLGELIQILKNQGRWEESVFFYAPDHGIDGKFSTYDRGLRVPLIMRWKGHVKEAASISALVHFIDIVPTLVEIAGGAAVEDIDGKSLLPLINGQVEAIHEAVFALQTRQNVQQTQIFPGRSITTDKLKLLVNFNALEVLDKNKGDNAVVNAYLEMGAKANPDRRFLELYDLSTDPIEQENLAVDPAMRAVRDAMLIQLLEWMRAQGDFIEPGKPLPLLKPTQHPLDKTTRFKEVPDHLEGQLQPGDFWPAHY